MDDEPSDLTNYRLKQIEIKLDKLIDSNVETRVTKLETQLATLKAVLFWLVPSGVVLSAVTVLWSMFK